jgi:hypothetical protein
MRRFLCRAARNGRRVGVVLAVSLLAGLTSVAATVPTASPATALSTSGYWLVGTDGGIFSYGAAKFFGSTGAIKLNQPIAGMAATPDGKGYWMVASDGGIFAFGSAAFYGSMGGKPLNQPIVGMAPTRTGRGYWLVASDGGIFAFGDAGFFGSTGAIKLSKRIQQMAATPSGKGYWMVAGDGGVFAFGDAKFYGSAADGGPEKRIVDIAASATGLGYYMTASNGAVYAYGDAKHYGGAEAQKLAHGIISMVALNSGQAPVPTNDVVTLDEDGTATIDVLANDRDPDGAVLSLLSVAPALHGTTAVEAGRIVYKPSSNYNGTDSFSYTIIDTNGQTAIGLVSVTVQSVNDRPTATDDAKTVLIGQTVTIDVLSNDSGLGDGLLDLSVLPPFPTKGTVTKSADGRALVYTPNKKGTDTILYRIVDTDGNNDEATVTVKVEGASPSAVDVGPIDCSANACRTDVSKAPNVIFGNGGQLTIVGEQNGSKSIDGGTFTRSGNEISFTATRGNVGQVSVDYQISDGTDTSTAKVIFNYHNSAPVAEAYSDSLPANTPKHYQLAFHDPDGDPVPSILFDSVSGPVDPTPLFVFNPDGSFDFAGGPAGVWEIKFRVSDGIELFSQVFTITTT